MPRINGKKRCANCFCEIKSEPCSNCGYSQNTAAFDAEALPRRTKLAEKYMNTFGSLGIHIFEFAETFQAYDENGSPLIARTENLGIFPALDCTECSVILPKNIVGKICGGLGFTGDNMIRAPLKTLFEPKSP